MPILITNYINSNYPSAGLIKVEHKFNGSNSDWQGEEGLEIDRMAPDERPIRKELEKEGA